MLENICQPVLAFSSNSFGSITHRGGRDARVPVRAASRRLSACRQAEGGLVLAVRFGVPFGFCPFRAGGIGGRFFTGRCPVLWAFCPVGA
jgi:hypothetical protein